MSEPIGLPPPIPAKNASMFGVQRLRAYAHRADLVAIDRAADLGFF
jgi:hypothetical protein